MADQGDDDEDLMEELGGQLYWASFDGEAAEAARLLDLNAPVNHREGDYQETALMIAALGGHIDVVTLLANRGGDLEARDIEGRTALMGASAKGHLAVVQLLVERKLYLRVEYNEWAQKLLQNNNITVYGFRFDVSPVPLLLNHSHV